MEEQDKLLEALSRGRLAGATGELVLGILSELYAAVDRRIYARLDKHGFIDESEAVQAWLEKRSYARLLGRLDQTKRAGEAAGRKLDPTMGFTAPWRGSASTPSTENGGYDGPGPQE